MKQQIALGPAPPNEDCAQVGQEDYTERARLECRRYIELLRRKLGHEPMGARLTTKSFPHELGQYLEVVCEYERDNAQATAFAHACEAHGPLDWTDSSPYDWHTCLAAMPEDSRSQDRRTNLSPETIETDSPF